MVGLVVFLVLAVAVVAWLLSMYNGLVRLREAVKQAFSNIGVLLRQRHDELPKLVETCRQYMSYEQETLERVLRARTQVSSAQGSGDLAQLAKAEGEMHSGLVKLFALAEQYPVLKANESFGQLQARITSLEEQIADRRELYNASVNLYNTRQAEFPDSVVAGMGDFKPARLLEFSADETSDVSVKQLFKG